jgi:hypothetical protein
MLALLLAAVTIPPTPQTTLTFPGAAPVTVTGPATPAGRVDFPWTLTQTLYAPGRRAAAVRFCWDAAKYTGCEVRLAQVRREALVLKNGNVKRLLWSADGRYLIGAGANTLRLWNLMGGVRTVTIRDEIPEANWIGQPLIRRLWLKGNDLCVAARDYIYNTETSARRENVSTSRYALPTLRGISVTTFPWPKIKEAPCQIPGASF